MRGGRISWIFICRSQCLVDRLCVELLRVMCFALPRFHSIGMAVLILIARMHELGGIHQWS